MSSIEATTGRPRCCCIAKPSRVWNWYSLAAPLASIGDGETFRVASEAQRIRLANLFDPYLAVHSSLIEPLPHQITAVYGEMLPRQPLRFLLADDPGAGKTIMAGLFIKELIIRGDVERCLIIAPETAFRWNITKSATAGRIEGGHYDREG
jgi:hypothetical protein